MKSGLEQGSKLEGSLDVPFEPLTNTLNSFPSASAGGRSWPALVACSGLIEELKSVHFTFAVAGGLGQSGPGSLEGSRWMKMLKATQSARSLQWAAHSSGR